MVQFQSIRMGGGRWSWAWAFVLMLSGAAAAKDEIGLSPQQLVREAVQNEISSNGESGPHFMFKDQKRTAHLSQTKLLIETAEATAGLLIEEGGQPLSPQRRQQEEARLASYIQNPDELRKKHKQEKEDADRSERILKALPDAFLYEPDGTQKGTESVGRTGDELVRLKFRPNPAYNPPSRVEQVLTGMTGHVLIDANEKRVAEIDGTLQKDVGFGWGILGHLDRGGRFFVQQADVGGRQWELTHMELSFTGKILLLKKLSLRSSDIFSDFRQVPSNLTFAQGVQLLEKEAAQINAKNKPGAPSDKVNAGVNHQPTNEAEKKNELCCDR